jgi:hypothetical protein
MGSITSHPVIPAAAQTVYVPVYTPTTTATIPPAAGTTDNSAAPPDTSTASSVKNNSLLERSRGVLSTVVTGFRGLLSDTNSNTLQRKTLLGE